MPVIAMRVAGDMRVIWDIEDANPRVMSITKFGDKRWEWVNEKRESGKNKAMNLST